MSTPEQDAIDARRYRLIRGESMIHNSYRKPRGWVISFPTIPTQPTNVGISYRDNFDAAVDAAMNNTLTDKSGEFDLPEPAK